jgi:1,4-dihydroxy-6-naphthoate synthase
MMIEKVLRVGHSPDADDAFMFYALAKGMVKLDGFAIEHVIEDIQRLNQRALKAELEITAISAAIYPMVQEHYWILSSGASVGRNYGPVIVSKVPFSVHGLKKKRIAVPGSYTTAFLLLNLFLDDFIPVQMDFKDVISAVLNHSVEAGVVIHEGQLHYGNFGLHKCFDLGQGWFEKYQLPIPLGLDVVRKDLGLEQAKIIQKALYESIGYARMNEKQALEYAAQFGRGTGRQTLQKFVRMYVNDDTLDLGAQGKKALEILFQRGAQKGFLPKTPPITLIY